MQNVEKANPREGSSTQALSQDKKGQDNKPNGMRGLSKSTGSIKKRILKVVNKEKSKENQKDQESVLNKKSQMESEADPIK